MNIFQYKLFNLYDIKVWILWTLVAWLILNYYGLTNYAYIIVAILIIMAIFHYFQ